MSQLAIVVTKSKECSKPGDTRYIVRAKKDGTILDDAQGYGYKSEEGALASWRYKNGNHYKNRSKRKEEERKSDLVHEWITKNKEFVAYLEMLKFGIEKGSDNSDKVFDEYFVGKKFQEEGLIKLPFTYKEFLDYWQV